MNNRVDVWLADHDTPRLVGTIADAGSGPHFQYARTFLGETVELSPLKLPRATTVYGPGPRGMHRLRGLFFDALPDGWGLRLLHDRMGRAGLKVADTTALHWLQALGSRGLGALAFRPATADGDEALGAETELLTLANAARAFETDNIVEALPELHRAGSASGGVRPKIVAGWNDSGAIVDAFETLPDGFRPVLIKFASKVDGEDLPLIEAAYLAMARRAGCRVPEHRAHPLPNDRWALVVDRFDRVGEARRHVHSFAGLLEADYQRDLFDYVELLLTTRRLTRDEREVEEAFRRAVFNVGAHNRDDHAKNTAFLMQPDGQWSLSPAFDLTYAAGPGGYHTMAIAGESLAPNREHLLALAQQGGLRLLRATEIIDEVRDALTAWLGIAHDVGVGRNRINEVAGTIATNSARLAPRAQTRSAPRGRKRTP